MKTNRLAVLAIVLAVVVAAAWFFLPGPKAPSQAEMPPPPPLAPPPVAQAPLTPVEPVAPPPIQHPVPMVEQAPAKPAAPAKPVAKPVPPRPLPELDKSDQRLREDMFTMLGRKKVEQFFILDNFVRRVVATVDNLGRDHAPPMLWPVHATPGRFTTLARPEGEVINPDNGTRYNALVQFVEAVNSRQVVNLYAQLYPLFQQAYVELGYPQGYFNDRLVQIVDLLLATPVKTEPLAVMLVDVKGPYQTQQPWTRYEFADPELEALAAGQKMLLRTGSANHQRLRTKLLEFRALLTKAALPANVANATGEKK